MTDVSVSPDNTRREGVSSYGSLQCLVSYFSKENLRTRIIKYANGNCEAFARTEKLYQRFRFRFI